MMKFYLLWHSYTDSDHEDSKFIGVFSSMDKASAIAEQFKLLPGFRVWPEGFVIDEWEPDKPSWTEGFSYPDPPSKCRQEK